MNIGCTQKKSCAMKRQRVSLTMVGRGAIALEVALVAWFQQVVSAVTVSCGLIKACGTCLNWVVACHLHLLQQP